MGSDKTSRIEGQELELQIPLGREVLHGTLNFPIGATSVVLFAHGSGSSRFSPRNRLVAKILQQSGMATLLLDLLTPEEGQIDMRTSELRFDISLLAERVVGATRWIGDHPDTHGLRIGYFGASTGAAAALVAAAVEPTMVDAVVSRGGRPDLAGDALPQVQAPTLLIVGGADVAVIGMNRSAMEQMRARCELEIVPGATHLFEEPGALQVVARLARDWFQQQLGSEKRNAA